MTFKKLICCWLLFNVMIIGGYSVDIKDFKGRRLKVMTESELLTEKAKGVLIDAENLQNIVNGVACWITSWLISLSNKDLNLEELVKKHALKIFVDFQELNLMTVDCGSCDRAVLLSATKDQCDILLILPNTQLAGNVTIATKENKIVIDNIQEVAYKKEIIEKTDQTITELQQSLDVANQQIEDLKKLYDTALNYLDGTCNNNLFKTINRFGIEGSPEEIVKQIETALQKLETTAEELEKGKFENGVIIQHLTQEIKTHQENYEKLSQEINKTHQEVLNRLKGLEDNIPVYVNRRAIQTNSSQIFELVITPNGQNNPVSAFLKRKVDGMEFMGFAGKNGVLKNEEELLVINNGKRPGVLVGNDLDTIAPLTIKGLDGNDYAVKISTELKETDEILQLLDTFPELIFNKKLKAYFVNIASVSETLESKKLRDDAENARLAEEASCKAEVERLKTGYPVYLDLDAVKADGKYVRLEYENFHAPKLDIFPNKVGRYVFIGYADEKGYLMKRSQINLFIDDKKVSTNIHVEKGQVTLENIESVHNVVGKALRWVHLGVYEPYYKTVSSTVQYFDVTLEVVPFNIPVAVNNKSVTGFMISIVDVKGSAIEHTVF